MIILEFIDQTKRTIHLHEMRWKHITTEHPDISLEHIEQTLKYPTTIRTSRYDDTVRWYYHFIKNRNNYCFVAVKYLNGTGFIITAYYVRRLT